MPPRKSKSIAAETAGGRRVTRLQAKLNETPPQKRSYLASSSCTKRNVKTSPIAAIGGRKGNKNSKFLVITDQEFSQYCSMMHEREYDNLPKDSEDITKENVASANVTNRMMPGEESASCHISPTSSFGLTEMAKIHDLEPDMDEVDSPAVCELHGYSVKQGLAGVLARVIGKYGDIAANYLMKTPESRSSALEEICQLVQNFEGKKFIQVSENDVTRSLSRVLHFGLVGMEVGWLKKWLEDILDAKRKVQESSVLRQKRERSGEVVKALKAKAEDNESQSIILKKMWDKDVENLNALKRKIELYEAKDRLLRDEKDSIMKDVKAAEDEAESIEQIVSEAKTKIKYLVEHPLMNGLL